MEEDEAEFTIKCKMKNRWVPHFCSMLEYMEYLGSVGSSRSVSLYSDGDGDFRPKFNISIPYQHAKPIRGEISGDHFYDAG